MQHQFYGRFFTQARNIPQLTQDSWKNKPSRSELEDFSCKNIGAPTHDWERLISFRGLNSRPIELTETRMSKNRNNNNLFTRAWRATELCMYVLSVSGKLRGNLWPIAYGHRLWVGFSWRKKFGVMGTPILFPFCPQFFLILLRFFNEMFQYFLVLQFHT